MTCVGALASCGMVTVAVLSGLLAMPAAAMVIDVDGLVLAPGQFGRQTIRISGLDKAVNSVQTSTSFDGEFGLDWWEDFGDGFELWGNEYSYFATLALAGPGTTTVRFDETADYGIGTFFVGQGRARLRHDGADVVLNLDIRLGRFDQRCERVPVAERQDFAVCGLRMFPAAWESMLAISGPGAASATWTVTTTTGMIPEPASWAMMIAGFGLVGGALRQQRRAAARS
jgi:hypothetical protein